MNSYAGIGSRETPDSVMRDMKYIAKYLSNKKYILNSGGAEGADAAFEEGAQDGLKQIFLPWNGFNNRFLDNKNFYLPKYNEEIVKKFHPNFKALKEKGKLLMSRNSYQVLGKDLQTPVKFVLCWTKDGGISGGTGQAMRIAKSHSIPIFNLKTDMDKMIYYFENFI